MVFEPGDPGVVVGKGGFAEDRGVAAAVEGHGDPALRRVARPKFGRVPKAQEAPPSAIISYLTVKSSFNSIPGGHLIDVPTDFLSSYQRAE